MKKFVSVLAAALLFASGAAGAREVDFVAKVTNALLDSAPPGNPRVVGLATFTNSGLAARGAMQFHFRITNADTEEVLFDGTATITSAQTTVDTGNANTGRITLTYDATTDQLEVRVLRKITALGYHYRVRINDDINWYGDAVVITTTVL